VEREEFLRAAWKVMVAQELDATRLVFVDEMGTNISLAPLYAWAPRGHRAPVSVPRNRGANTPHCAFEHEFGRDGSIPGGGRLHHRAGL
jgi:hypothetical protein